ncbi:MAG: glycogen synthase [Candidatus Abyssubacteria bacterium]
MGRVGKVARVNDLKLLLLFTRGISLGVWNSIGMLEREVALYRRLRPELAKIRFLTYGDESERDFEGMLDDIQILPNERKLSPTKFSLLAPLLFRNEFREADVIKTNQLDGAWTGVIAKLLYRKKLIVRCGYIWSVFQRNQLGDGFDVRISHWLEKLCLKLADVCVVATERDAGYIRKEHGISDSRIRVVPNYVDTDLFKPMPEIKREDGLVCFVGRLAPQKNVEALFEACHGLDGVKLLIIGDGHLREELTRKAEELALGVEFHLSIPNRELPKHLNRAQVFVLPSHYEGCPKTLLEAMACELPVIGTNVEGIRDIIRDGENGILCEKSPQGIRNALRTVFADPPSAEAMGKRARRYVVERHSLEHIVERELKVIESLTMRMGQTEPARS